MSKIHKLKTIPPFFTEVRLGVKTFEYRKNDRDYREGDILLLQEWNDGYSGGEILMKVTHVLYDYEFKEIKTGCCIMSIKPLTP